MRRNVAGLALSVGMALIVLLMGFAVLSAAGLVGFSADEPLAEQATPEGPAAPSAPKENVLPVSQGSAGKAAPGDAAAIAAGDALFKNNCAQCHALNEKVVGPALAGISKRRPTAWVVSWVHNSSKVIASGDEYAVKLFDDNGKQQMPAFPQLSDKDIKAIVAWVSAQEGGATSGVTVAMAGQVVE